MDAMERFKECLREQLHNHSGMTPQDVVKLCYQAACGAEHLLSDLSGAKQFFDEEFESVSASCGLLYECISDKVCRINLGAWKQLELPSEWLFRMFTGTVFQTDGKSQLVAYLNAAEEVLCQVGYDLQMWHEYLTAYIENGMPAVRHSEQYRQAEHPAYRIVETEYLKLIPILKKLHSLNQSDCSVIAIDGKAGAGKSTIAALLRNVLDAGVVYMDDFFLPPSMRTEIRLAEAGGNIYYERFAEQVLPYLKSRKAFEYDRFDCSCMEYNGKCAVTESAYRIVEGSYSHHPRFGDYMDLRVFVDVDSKEQLRRITARNGADMAKMFRTRWIPMENRYFDTYEIFEQSDIVIVN